MTLSTGSRLGPYEILAPLGAGGMGEVYKAKDTRLDRTVAVKVLPAGLSGSPEVRQRFEREARAISALSHPHICALYDVGSESGVEYLVMEYLDGETLAERLARGPLATEQVVKIGAAIADALEAAHRQGIIHRDLKPGNVMLTKSGVKLLDFGLAKSLTPSPSPAGRGWPEGPDEGLSKLPTEGAQEKPLTERGTVLGTFQYMAPEQIEGREADARSDIFALGCVLYEMAAGRRAFSGGSRASLIGAILKDQPAPISAIQPMTPPALDRLVQTCLAKDPEDRFQTAHDVKLQLRWIAEAGSQAGAPAVVVSRRRSRERLAWTAAAAAALAAIALAVALLRHPSAAPRVVRSSIDLPSGVTVVKRDTSLALSPDGRVLAVCAIDLERKTRIYLRELDSLVFAPLPNTEGATYPFWSPDGASLGFFADGKLKRIDVAGGAVQTICDAPQGRGGTWGPDGTIVFAPDVYGGLLRVPSSGGTAAPAERPVTGETVSHRNPHFLPGGTSVLYYAAVGFDEKEASVRILDLATKKDRLVVRAPSEAYFVAPGYLAFLRQKNVMIQPFDPKTGRLSGEAVPIAEDVQYNSFRGTGEFCFAGADLFAYQTESPTPRSELTWFDLDGRTLGSVGDPASYGGFAVAPDGKTAAASIETPEGNNIWLVDLVRGVRTRFTFDLDGASNPVWSPDGRRIVYTASSAGRPVIQVKNADGGSPAQTIYTGTNFYNPDSWAPDGSAVSFHFQSDQTRSFDVGIFPMTSDHTPRMLVASPANEMASAFSPDGRWLAYTSDESGRLELYVIPYPGPGGKWQISSGGALGMWWSGPGEIDYVASDRRVFAVDLKPRGTGLTIGAPRRIFAAAPFPVGGFDYSRSLKRVLALTPVGEAPRAPITLVTNWAGALKK